MTLLIKNGLLDGQNTDILIDGNRISQIRTSIDKDDVDEILDARGKAVLPGLMNGHTHAAMTLLRGFGDDMDLHDWLSNRIWPIEAKMNEEHVYWGTKLACLEMIKSGTTFFSDMYWHWHGSVRAVSEMGLRANLAGVFIDLFDDAKAKQQIQLNEQLYNESRNLPDRITFCLGPHAIYTVSERSLIWIKSFAQENDIVIHMHASESRKEVEECVEKTGLRPIEYLNKIDFLGSNVVLAHAIWLNENEIRLIEEHDVRLITNPCANMKLATGEFQYCDLDKQGIKIGIGTDGVASNNNFDLFEELKFLALSEKRRMKDPTVAPAKEMLNLATRNNATIYDLACGEIKIGNFADIILVDLTAATLTPGHNLSSDLIYAANGSVVDTVICDGKILMKNRVVDNEKEIVARAKEIAKRLVHD